MWALSSRPSAATTTLGRRCRSIPSAPSNHPTRGTDTAKPKRASEAMKIGTFYLPAIGSKAELEQGMAGRRTDLYQRMLKHLLEQAQYMDAHGYYGVGFTEHHFHIEGEEVSNNPVLLDCYIGMGTKNIRVGQLGIVLPAQNPLRVAEDVAMLDQMTEGRAFAGFARGYQPRWVNTLGQHYPGLSDSSTNPEDYERIKKDLYEEHWE